MPAGEDDRSGVTPYRWTCPICGDAKAGIAGADENWRSKAVGGLRTHIRSQAGEGHGPHQSLPPGLDEDSLLECIETPADR